MVDIKDLKLSYSHRAMMLMESITGEPFMLDGSITKTFLFLWCVIEVNNQGVVSVEELNDLCDTDPMAWKYLNDWLANELKNREKLLLAEPKGGKKKRG